MEGEGFELVGAVGVAGEMHLGFGCVGSLACGEAGVFGVVEHEVFHAKFLCLLAGVKGCAVVLVVGAELFSVFIEAECFAKQPVAIAHIFLVARVVGLVAEAHHALVVGHEHAEAVLRSLGGAEVETGHFHVVDQYEFAVVDFSQDDGVADGALNLAWDEELANGGECVTHFLVAVNHEARVLSFVDERRYFAYEPDDAQNVVGVDMGDEDMANFLVWDVSLVELAENAVAATGIHKHPTRFSANVEAGVVTAGAHGVAYAEESD